MELEYMWLKKLSNSKQNRVSEFLLSLYFNGIWHFGIFFGAYMDSLTISMSVSSSIPNTVGILAVGQWFLFLSVVPNKDRTNKKNLVGGWAYPSEKYEFVRLDHHPNIFGENKILKHVPNHQPATSIYIILISHDSSISNYSQYYRVGPPFVVAFSWFIFVAEKTMVYGRYNNSGRYNELDITILVDIHVYGRYKQFWWGLYIMVYKPTNIHITEGGPIL